MITGGRLEYQCLVPIRTSLSIPRAFQSHHMGTPGRLVPQSLRHVSGHGVNCNTRHAVTGQKRSIHSARYDSTQSCRAATGEVLRRSRAGWLNSCDMIGFGFAHRIRTWIRSQVTVSPTALTFVRRSCDSCLTTRCRK